LLVLALLLAVTEVARNGWAANRLALVGLPIALGLFGILVLPISTIQLLPPSSNVLPSASGDVDGFREVLDTAAHAADLKRFLSRFELLTDAGWSSAVNWGGRSVIGRFLRESKRLKSVQRLGALSKREDLRELVVSAQTAALECLYKARPQARFVDELLKSGATPPWEVIRTTGGELTLRRYVEEAASALVLQNLITPGDLEILCRPFEKILQA